MFRALGVFMYINFWIIEISFDSWWFQNVFGLISLFFVTATTLLGLYCHMIAASTPPGSPPEGWTPSGFSDEQLEEARTVNQPSHFLRFQKRLHWCKKCKLFKPPRTHHCTVCKKCIYRMDHHCVWINNCVG
jgi:hypothetical protein